MSVRAAKILIIIVGIITVGLLLPLPDDSLPIQSVIVLAFLVFTGSVTYFTIRRERRLKAEKLNFKQITEIDTDSGGSHV